MRKIARVLLSLVGLIVIGLHCSELTKATVSVEELAATATANLREHLELCDRVIASMREVERLQPLSMVISERGPRRIGAYRAELESHVGRQREDLTQIERLAQIIHTDRSLEEKVIKQLNLIIEDIRIGTQDMRTLLETNQRAIAQYTALMGRMRPTRK